MTPSRLQEIRDQAEAWISQPEPELPFGYTFLVSRDDLLFLLAEVERARKVVRTLNGAVRNAQNVLESSLEVDEAIAIALVNLRDASAALALFTDASAR